MRKSAIEYLELPSFITDTKFLDFANEALLIHAKETFFHIPASSSGKYHPAYALGPGGLIRHTKACMVIANELFHIYGFNEYEKNVIQTALALHDIDKPDKFHPITVKLTLEAMNDHIVFDDIINLIESHMGQWDQFGKLPQPKTTGQKFVHLCDYIASRRVLNFSI